MDVRALLEAEARKRGLLGEARHVPDYAEWFLQTLPKGWSVPEHVRLINEHLEAVERGDIDRLAIHMPPRHGKSETVTIRHPLRHLELSPEDNVLITGYNERFARKFSRRIRNMAAERGLVAPDKSATDEWSTREGGLCMARGVGSPPTGTGFSLIVIDDPVRSREDAESEVYREKVWDWYTDDLYTRLEPGGALVLCMTLWHEDDLGARAVASEPDRWTVLKMPAISEDGEALWPERYTVADLERIRDVMSTNEGERSFEALYQQNPKPREGSLIQREWLKPTDAIPWKDIRWVVRYWDLAVSEKLTADYTAGALVAYDNKGDIYILDVERFRESWPVAAERIADLAEAELKVHKEAGRVYNVGIDSRSTQLGFVQDLFTKGTFHRVPLWPDTTKGDKVQRASGWAARARAGKVHIQRGAWNGMFLDECTGFPLGKHDDMVDAVSGAYELLWRLKGGNQENEQIEIGSRKYYEQYFAQFKR
jgi:predicted phage terminase large subunit-like protein